MKNVSKLALFVAAGMMTAGAHAATIDIREDTTMEIEGEFAAEYVTKDTVDTSQTGNSDNQNDLSGAAEIGVSAVRSFDNFDAYVETTFKFSTLETGGSSLEADGAAAGLEGAFGQIEVGQTDSVYEDLITDALDFFEQADLAKANKGVDEGSMLTYYSPSLNGLSFNLQAAFEDEAEGTDDNSEQALQASAAYDFGVGAFHIGYNEADIGSSSSDEVLGLAVSFDLGNSAEVALKHEMQTVANVDTDFTGIGIAVDYGMGDIYGAYQAVSEDGSDDQSQYAVGVDTEIEDGFKLYAELANFDGQAAADADSLMSVGLVYDF